MDWDCGLGGLNYWCCILFLLEKKSYVKLYEGIANFLDSMSSSPRQGK